MSNPWPTQPWPQPSQSAWGAPVAQPPITLDQALQRWDAAKQTLEAAKDAEIAARKLAFSLGFGAEAKEGVNTIELNNGFELKGTKKLTYTLEKPQGFQGSLEDAILHTEQRFVAISNEGAFIAERIFKWSIDFSVAEYRKLCEEAKTEVTKKLLLDEVHKVLVIKEAAPTLAIKAPKQRRG